MRNLMQHLKAANVWPRDREMAWDSSKSDAHAGGEGAMHEQGYTQALGPEKNWIWIQVLLRKKSVALRQLHPPSKSVSLSVNCKQQRLPRRMWGSELMYLVPGTEWPWGHGGSFEDNGMMVSSDLITGVTGNENLLSWHEESQHFRSQNWRLFSHFVCGATCRAQDCPGESGRRPEHQTWIQARVWGSWNMSESLVSHNQFSLLQCE